MSRTTITLQLNGRPAQAEVEGRTHLADHLREHHGLTGTHLGCEHGVCGACTVELDGSPARSCITYAAACDGRSVRTIEGYDHDPLMMRLRAAFSAEHALQCGYCTPGMLVTAHDIVRRLPQADEARIRLELAGNLCRCTGYRGIVRAIQRVLREQAAERAASRARVGARRWSLNSPSCWAAPPSRRHGRHFHDFEALAACLPGATVTGTVGEDGAWPLRFDVKLGPIAAAFAGSGRLSLDEAARSGRFEGSATDKRSPSRVKGRRGLCAAARGRGAAGSTCGSTTR